jgi:ATP-binding cassette, subfamily G (WHITE), member 2, SNQ2
MDAPTPKDTDVPGGFPETPSLDTANQTPTQESVAGTAGGLSQPAFAQGHASSSAERPSHDGFSSTSTLSGSPAAPRREATAHDVIPAGAVATAAGTRSDSALDRVEKLEQPSSSDSDDEDDATVHGKPKLQRKRTIQTEDDLFRVLSRRRTTASRATSDAEKQEEAEETAEINRLMSRMFGHARQEHSEEEQTRHSGVIFRNLTVKGVGLGASLQPTVGDIFLGLPRVLNNLVRKGPSAAFAKPAVRELISQFDGCVRPGELLLVLGRPGAGCTTFLKAFCNQRFGFAGVEGDVTYGGTDAEDMAKHFRGDVIYNPEDDLHYATLNVRRTLTFALQTRTPGKESRLEGESRKDYVAEFLRIVTKLFWIEHTLGTKVGNEFVRGVSGGERKRVSIAEAMITRASVQGWDNSSKGLDASTALEYVRAIRAMTTMADTSTAVSLYQAGESLYQLADKVLLIDEGQCLYFGPADGAKKYFQTLGFDCPERWTTPDFLTSVTDAHERSVRLGWEDRIPRSAQEFSEAYRRSDVYQKNLQDIEEFEGEVQEQARQREARQSEKTAEKNYTLPFHQQVIACTKRQFLVMIGDRPSLFGKWGGLTFQGLIVGSLFFNTPSTAAGAFPRGGTLFFLLLFNALLALAEQTVSQVLILVMSALPNILHRPLSSPSPFCSSTRASPSTVLLPTPLPRPSSMCHLSSYKSSSSTSSSTSCPTSHEQPRSSSSPR